MPSSFSALECFRVALAALVRRSPFFLVRSFLRVGGGVGGVVTGFVIVELAAAGVVGVVGIEMTVKVIGMWSGTRRAIMMLRRSNRVSVNMSCHKQTGLTNARFLNA